MPLPDQPALAEAPEWQLGDEWVFKTMHGFTVGHLTVRVAHGGPGGYILSALEDGEEWYWLPEFRLVGIVRAGQIENQFLPPMPVLNFPMRAGATWRQATSSGET